MARHPKRQLQTARVALGTLMGDDGCGFQFFSSWDAMRDYDWNGAGHIKDVVKIKSGPRLVETRTEMATVYMRDFPECDYLLTIDADMGYPVDTVEHMLKVMIENDIKVLGGLCFGGGTDRMFPTIYTTREDMPGMYAPRPVCQISETAEEGFKFEGQPYPRDQLVKVTATGTGLMMIHRDVFTLMCAEWPRGFGTDKQGNRNPYPWFAEATQFGHAYGEDIVFCQRAMACGFDVYVDTRLKIDHYKIGALLNEKQWDARLSNHYGERAEKYRVPPPPKELVLA